MSEEREHRETGGADGASGASAARGGAEQALAIDRRTLLSGALLAAGLLLGSTASPLAPVRSAAAAPQLTGSSSRGRRRDARLRRRAFAVRSEAAQLAYQPPVAPHPDNGDDERYPNRIGSDTRGLPHDARGEVKPSAYAGLLLALSSEEPRDFEQIELGGTRKLVNPLGTLAVSLTGSSPTQLGVAPAPALASAEKAGEAVELYWKALLRDLPLGELRNDTRDPTVLAAVDELSRLEQFRGPRSAGWVTPETLFRGTVAYPLPSGPRGLRAKYVVPPGVLEGPYLSQLLLRDIPYGPTSIAGRVRTALPGNDFQTDFAQWLSIQNGAAPTRATLFDPVPRWLWTGRDLAEYVHGGAPSFWGAALLISAAEASGGLGAPLSPTNPYLSSRTQASAAASFALAYFQGLLTLGSSRAIRAAYWQKWFVHRSVRPEAYGGLVQQRSDGSVPDYPLHDSVLDSVALAQTRAEFGSYLLPQAFPEGAPLHGSYPGGAAATAGVSVTLLKAAFDESTVIPNPVVADPADPTRLVPYSGPPLTLGGELNKLAANASFGRNWAGIHWRSDASASLWLGEQVAIQLLREERLTLRESFEGFRFHRFDGSAITI